MFIRQIFFTTALEIDDLAIHLGLRISDESSENYWMWVIGMLDGYELDITRTHTLPPKDTETKIFMLNHGGNFTNELMEKLISRLKLVGVTSIRLGVFRKTKKPEIGKYKFHHSEILLI